MRKELQEFYEKEAERKKNAELSQIKVGTEYQKAVSRINRIHEKNEEFSHKAEADLDKELKRNSHADERLREKKRTVSCANNEVTLLECRK